MFITLSFKNKISKNQDAIFGNIKRASSQNFFFSRSLIEKHQNKIMELL